MTPRLLDEAALPALIEALQSASCVAVDTEFHAERRYFPKLLLVQLALPDGATWIIDPLAGPLLAHLAPALLKLPWVVHAGFWDLRLLAPVLGGLPADIYDTQVAAGLVSAYYPASLANLCANWLGRTLDKGETLSDWAARPLQPGQIRYAAADAAVLLPLRAKLTRRAKDLGREALITQACTAFRDEALAPTDHSDAWREIGGHAHLDAVGQATLVALAAWREDLAAQLNTPARSLVADGLLLDLARRRPTTEAQALSNRRFPAAVLRKHGEALLGIVMAAERHPVPSPRPAPNVPADALPWLALDVAAIAWGKRAHLATRLLLSTKLRDGLGLCWGEPDAAAACVAAAGWRSEPLSGLAGIVAEGALSLSSAQLRVPQAP